MLLSDAGIEYENPHIPVWTGVAARPARPAWTAPGLSARRRSVPGEVKVQGRSLRGSNGGANFEDLRTAKIDSAGHTDGLESSF